jgi:GNAT superfamily N-acetyltransferase
MIQVEPATPQDRAALLELFRAQYDEHAIEISDARLASGVDGVLSDARRGFILVARDDAKVIGFAGVTHLWSFEHGGPAAWLEELFVLPERRAHGIGGALIEATIDLARSRGCLAVDLEVEASHARAETLYLRHDFVRHSRARFVRRL